MTTIGIICEYNPFHLGHLYHINKIKELYPDSLIILVLNGYFLERGEISIQTKEDKTRIALQHGVDLVLELPVIYGTQSADIFADISLKILNNFHIDKLIFGSECNDIEQIKSIAKKQIQDPIFDETVKVYLKEGINYPTALAKALNQSDFSFLPNDLLGISYVKSIIKNNYKIDPLTIKRTSDYLDTKSKKQIISASNIREKLRENKSIKENVPSMTLDSIVKINEDKYFDLLKYKINTSDTLDEFLDVDEGINYRLKKYINESNDLNKYMSNIKTKRYTYNKLNRMFIHILLGIKKSDNTFNLDYIKILGFTKEGQAYLSSNEFEISTAVNKESIIYKYELLASLIYDLINNTNTYKYELKNQPVIIT